MTKIDAQKNKIAEYEIATSSFTHRSKSMAAGNNFLKGDLSEAWLGGLDESILDETFEPLFDKRVNKVRT